MKSHEKVNIQPGVRILSIFQNIEYDPWFALAEYVDNAIDSFQKYEKELKKKQGEDYCLKVEIEINSTDNTITIRDNAAGIHQEDYIRAFRTAEVPPDNTGLSEFGIGMKSASFWFSKLWTVRTTALGESIEKKVTFDLNKIFHGNIEELDITQKEVTAEKHYTEIYLQEVTKLPKKKTIDKIRRHLSSIYRKFLREKKLRLFFQNEELFYSTPEILIEPYHKKPHHPEGKTIEWKKEIHFDLDDNLSIHGFVALRKQGSTSKAGFALFRRGRVIQGSDDETFRPHTIFGRPNSFENQRIFGELHLEGFAVSFTKRKIDWDENMDVFLDLLKHDISHKDFPLIQQARNYRVKPNKNDYKKTSKALLNSETKKYQEPLKTSLQEIQKNSQPEISNTLTPTKETSIKDFEIELDDIIWHIVIELSYDPAIDKWIEVGDFGLDSETGKDKQRIEIRLSLTHLFSQKYGGTDKSRIEPLLRIACAIGLAEKLASMGGVKYASRIRHNLNQILDKFSEI